MKIEKLKLDQSKKILVIIGIIVLLIFIYAITSTRAKYKIEKEIDLANGNIEYKVPDLNVVAIYVKGSNGEFTLTDKVPTDKTYQVVTTGKEKSYCVDQLSGTLLDNVNMKYENGKISIDIAQRKTKCWVYLEEGSLLRDVLKPSSKTYTEKSSFTAIATTDEGMFKIKDYDGEDSYYFRGNVTNNYVKFAGFYWRVIRVNSDGSIRMIYDGTRAYTNGESSEDRQIGTSAYNTSYNDAKYVGLKYGGKKDEASTSYESAHKNETNSDVLNKLESWYKTNIKDKNYDSYIEKNAIFCNDRRSTDNYNDLWSEWLTAGAVNKQGWGGEKLITAYGPRMRVYSNSRNEWQATQYADLSCQVNDRFTSSDATRGNKAMQYPVGLITLDEVLMGGGFGGQANDKYYLYTGQYYWTMSPVQFWVGDDLAYVFHIDTDGNLYGRWVTNAYGVRPVINLKADTVVSKDSLGTKDSPYEVI